jgi:XTP/dITP diphosphohydrolase
MKKIVLASANIGKIKEFKELLKNFEIEVIPQAELNVEETEETGLSFIENALIKARHASQKTGLPALSDDSGLTVDSLNGAPGIYSARYAGTPANDKQNIQKLLSELKDVPDDKRQASFYCVLVFLSNALDPVPLVCTGKWTGCILREPKGEQGFGYDPIFFVPQYHQTAAELPRAIKNTISHRGIALQSLLTLLPEKL